MKVNLECEENKCIKTVLYSLYCLVTFLGFNESFLAGGDQQPQQPLLT